MEFSFEFFHYIPTNDGQQTINNPLQIYSHRINGAALDLLVDFVQWCENSFLQLSIRTCWSISDANVVKGQAVEQLDKYKYLDMFIDDKLSFDHKTKDLQEGTSNIVYIT